MINIKEMKNGNDIYYEQKIINENISSINIIHYRTIIKEKDNYEYLIIYDKNMKVIRDAFKFLNFEIGDKTINTRIKSLSALKFLYSFKDIISKELKDFNTKDFNNLKTFLKGISYSGQTMNFELGTIRNKNTINLYLGTYRQYFEFLGIEIKALNQSKNGSINIVNQLTQSETKTKNYLISEKGSNTQEIPKYISIQDFKRIIEVVRNEYTIREEIIVRLMWQCGLRLGEVLGITAEDLKVINSNNKYMTTLFIRNRVCDKKYQHAKTCMKVFDKKQYKSKEYNLLNVGHQIVIVPKDLYDLINDYIEELHIEKRESHEQYYFNKTIADIVEKGTEENYYVFLNNLGKPMSDITWNKILREIFEKANLTIDKGVRNNNLNHRFRHGCAMFNVKYKQIKPLELMILLRHKSLSSVSCYFKPTMEDKLEILENFENSHLLDFLKKGK